MDSEKFYYAAECLHVMVQSSIEKLTNSESASASLNGYLDNLKGNSFYLTKINDLKERKCPKFGVFGPRKRGKSSMLNALIGQEILPVSGAPMTRTAVEVHHDEGCPRDLWKLTVYFPDGRIERTEHLSNVVQVNEKLKIYGTAYAKKNMLAQKIEIRSNFSSCKILQSGGILVDTPGAEPAMGKDSDVSASPQDSAHLEKNDDEESGLDSTDNDPSLPEDTELAMQILQTVDVVIFCARGDILGNKLDQKFYRENLSGLRPLIVVNCKDVWKGHDKDPVAEVVKTYGFPWDRTLAFSSVWANSKDLQSRENSGKAELEQKILAEIKHIKSSDGIVACFDEYNRNVENYIKNKRDDLIMPRSIDVINFYKCLSNSSEKWAMDMAGTLKTSAIWARKIP